MRFSTIVKLFEKGLITPFALEALGVKDLEYHVEEMKKFSAAWARLWSVLAIELIALALIYLFVPDRNVAVIVSVFVVIVGTIMIVDWDIAAKTPFDHFKCSKFWTQLNKHLQSVSRLLNVGEEFFLIVSESDLKDVATGVLGTLAKEVLYWEGQKKLEQAALARANFKIRHKLFHKIGLADEDWGKYFPKKDEKPYGLSGLLDFSGKICKQCQSPNSPTARFCRRCGIAVST